MRISTRLGFALCFALGAALPAFAQQPKLDELKFPQDPRAWVNFVPVPAQSLAGKGIVMWFYEEDCPTCRRKWPEMLQTSAQFEGQPVVFLAINSGNSRQDVEAYARDVNLTWPIIVDPDRSLEKQCGVTQISLENIYQMRIIKADGSMANGNPNDFAGSIKTALEGAAWKVDPKEMPAELKPAWMAIELGQFAKSAAGLKKGLKSKDEQVKAGADKLNAFVQGEIARLAEDAKAKAAAGEDWPAWQAFHRITETFAGLEIPQEILAAKEELAKDEKIAAEIAAAKKLDVAKKSGQRGGASATRRALTQLKALVKAHPGTQAAEEAQRIVDEVEAGKE